MTHEYEAFFSGFEKYARRAGQIIELRRRKAHPHMRLIPIDGVPIRHAHFAVVVTREDSRVLPHRAGKRVELVLEKKYAEHYFAALTAQEANIKAEIRGIDWHDAPIGSASHVDLWKPHNLDNPDASHKGFEWLMDNLLLFQTVLAPLIRDARERLRV